MKSQPRVLFVCERPWERIAKLGKALQARGIPVMLLHMYPTSFNTAECFDYSMECNSAFECMELIQRLTPEIIHLFSMSSDELSMLIAQYSTAKLVYDYKDMFENVIVDPADPFRWKCQRILVDRADGICARDRQIENYCRVNNVTLRGPTLTFPDYCLGSDETPRKPKIGGPDEIHLTMVGTFIPEDVCPDWMSHGYFFIAEAMVLQDIHLHIYPTPWTSNAMNSRSDSVYRQMAELTPNFHLHPTVRVDELISEISQYDFGIILYQGALCNLPENFHLNKHYEYGSAARMFDYLEAGLDVLVQDCLTTQAAYLKDYSFGNLIGPDFLKTDMKSQLVEWKNDASKKEAIVRARQELSIDAHAFELAAFYRML